MGWNAGFTVENSWAGFLLFPRMVLGGSRKAPQLLAGKQGPSGLPSSRPSIRYFVADLESRLWVNLQDSEPVLLLLFKTRIGANEQPRGFGVLIFNQ